MHGKGKNILKLIGVFLLPVALFVFFSIAAPGFGLKSSLRVVVGQSIIPIMLGFGMAFGMAAGLFDLSAGSRVILSAAMGGMLAADYGMVGLIVGCLFAGIASSVIMGIGFNVLRIPSLVLSLGFVMIMEIIASSVMGTKGFLSIPANLAALGKAPWNYVICVVFAILFYIIYYRTKLSSSLQVVGDNETLAKNMGIKPKRVYFYSYLLGGIFFGVAGILQIGYSGSVSSVVNMSSLSMCFQPMMGVMIGIELCSLLDNMMINIIIGELCISTIFNGLIALGLPDIMQDVFLGLFMIIVMAVSANRGVLHKYKLNRGGRKAAAA